MFFISEIGLDILKDALENCIIFLVWAAWVLCNSYLTQKQRFSVCSFKKMPPSSPPVGKFCLDIQEYISLTRLTFPKSKNNNNNNKNMKKMEVPKKTSSIGRMFALLRIYCLNAEVQKQNEI